ncbi:MAG: DedA family protein [Breznakibacter sp.]|nr:DedA family protein [Breznakibacter sp.]
MTESLISIGDYILHLDKNLAQIVTEYQQLTYIILFIIFFCETGLVIMPFLPGDTLLFAVGTIAAIDGNPLNIVTVIMLLLVASFLGDNTNFFIGRSIGHKLYKRNFVLIKRDYIDRTHLFYEKYGTVTLIFARFVPIIRTFAPFVAGIGEMDYHKFVMNSIVGNILWVVSFSLLGYFFGNMPFVKDNFILTIGVITLLSIMPAIVTLVGKAFKNMKTAK